MGAFSKFTVLVQCIICHSHYLIFILLGVKVKKIYPIPERLKLTFLFYEKVLARVNKEKNKKF